ncbi:MAG: lycopene cyclase [Flavobacterium sp.]|nr:lycopene cyclase [Flavobacterium sp.]
MKHYDYIFAGAGLASLMTIYKMILSKKIEDKTILLIDNDNKKNNDRTWCFWEKPGHNWSKIVSKSWQTAFFVNENSIRSFEMKPYEYNMIRGLDFYNLVFDLIEKQPNIIFVNDKVISYHDDSSQVAVICESQNYSCGKLFNSIYDKNLVINQKKFPVLQQHFVGWFIKSEQAVFDPQIATFMDFSIPQNGNTKFMYVLPTSTTEALLEPTLFSHKHLKREEYELEINNYAKKLGIKNFEILEKERGSIPMTSYPFWKNNYTNILNIGTAGGWTKASTGFTFYHTNKKSDQLIAFLDTNQDFKKFHKKTKFWYYDLILLDVLDKQNELGSNIFSSLLMKGNTELIFKFLNEETNFLEDLKIMLKCPTIIFVKAFFRVLWNM